MTPSSSSLPRGVGAGVAICAAYPLLHLIRNTFHLPMPEACGVLGLLLSLLAAAFTAARRTLWADASAFMSVIAGAAGLTLSPDHHPTPLLLAAVISAVHAISRRDLRPAAGALVWTLAFSHPMNLERARAWMTDREWRLLALAAFALILAVGAALSDWRLRGLAWRTDVRKLLDPPPRRLAIMAAAAAFAGLTALDALLALPHWSAPISLLLVSVAMFIAGHMSGRPLFLAYAMSLLGGTIALGGLAWSGGFGGLATGSVIGAGFLLWLARFWQQQLLNDTPWTTAGRAIPAARRTAQAMSLVALLSTAAAVPTLPSVGAGLLAAVLLLMALYFTRDAGERQESLSAAAAATLVVSSAWIIENAGWAADPPTFALTIPYALRAASARWNGPALNLAFSAAAMSALGLALMDADVWRLIDLACAVGALVLSNARVEQRPTAVAVTVHGSV